MLVLPDPSVPDGVLGIAVVCWRALSRGTDIPWLLLVRLFVGVTLLALLARVAVLFIESLRRQGRDCIERSGALRAVAEVCDGVWWIPCDEPVAFSLGGGRRGIVVASTGLRGLDGAGSGDDAVAAVLAHERAHVRGLSRSLAVGGLGAEAIEERRRYVGAALGWFVLWGVMVIVTSHLMCGGELSLS